MTLNKTIPNNTSCECSITEHWSGDTTVIIGCVGVFDILTAPEVERRIAGVLEKNPTLLIVDLTGIEFLASHGMNVLLAAHGQCGAGTTFAVVADGPVTRRPMQLIGITDMLTVYPTLDDALGSPEA